MRQCRNFCRLSNHMQSIDTPRLRLRPMVEEDASFLVALLNEPAFLRHIGDKGVRTVEDAKRYMEGPQQSYREHGYGMAVVDLQESDAPIGICGLVRRDWLPAADLGFAFLPEYSGRGFALEAAQATLDFARDELGMDEVLAIVSPANAASLRLLGKLGFGDAGRTQPPGEGQPILLFSLHLPLERAVAETPMAEHRLAG